nr:MAG TPA: hypothetical protein [Caudoviricetes sp.]
MIAFIKTVLAFLTTYKKYASALLIIAGFALSAWLGSSYQKAKCEAQIADFKAQIAIQTAEQRKSYEKRISEATSRLVLESRRADANRAERDDLLRRLRVASARADGASANPNRSYRAEYAQCRRFLSEGAGLLSEGSELAGRIAREKDALAEIVK